MASEGAPRAAGVGADGIGGKAKECMNASNLYFWPSTITCIWALKSARLPSGASVLCFIPEVRELLEEQNEVDMQCWVVSDF